VKYIQGLLSSLIAYPIAERQEKRYILNKRTELRTYYKLSFDERKQVASAKLADMIEYAGHAIPYYRDLFQAQAIDPAKLRQDIRYLTDIPFLTKEIIREQGTRLLSHPLQEIRHHVRQTGGSTGLSCQLYYDQKALDYSAAVTLYARETAGKKMHMFELHFASRFPDVFPLKARLREQFKCFTMNRYNLFFDRLDEKGLDETWSALCRRKAHLVHAHPSTIYALACHIERTRGSSKAFDIFESSGELLEPYMRDKIERVLQCRVVDRYGLAEFGVIGYQTMPDSRALMVLDSEGWMESSPAQESSAEQPEIVFTGFRNRLMPLIRYRTGDLGHLTETEEGLFLNNMVGRIHDLIPINGITYPTHYIQDVLDRVGGIQEFQIDLRETPPLLLLVPETGADTDNIRTRLNTWWQDGFRVEFGAHNDLVRVGNRSKFRHVVKAMAQ
jgi:phenylacetate-CoA ligase